MTLDEFEDQTRAEIRQVIREALGAVGKPLEHSVPVLQWLVFRGIGHAQVGTNEVIPHLPIVACGRTAWPGITRYQSRRPGRVCEECSAAIEGTEKRQTPSAKSPPPLPKQGSLF